MACCALAVVAVTLVLTASSPGSAYLAATVAGVAAANVYPSCIGLVLGANPHSPDLSVARASLVSTVATMTWPLFLGWIADRIGLGQSVYLLFILVAVAAVAVLWAKPKTVASRILA